MTPRHLSGFALGACAFLCTPVCLADEPITPARTLRLQPLPGDQVDKAPVPDNDLKSAFPRYAFVESPWGFDKPGMFAALAAGGVTAKGQSESQGGLRLGGAFDRLTVHALLGRGLDQRWSPTATAHVRLLGSPQGTYALGLMGQYKAEGFTEAGGEAELGVTFGLRHQRFYLEANALAGAGLEEEEGGEVDAEGKLRVGFRALDLLRVGAEGQFRQRVSGDRRLPGNKTNDWTAGPQAIFASGPLFAAVTGGATSQLGQTGSFGVLTVGALSGL